MSAGAEPSQSHWRKLHKRLGTERWPVEYGPDCVSSSHLPSHSDVHVSVITGQRIRVCYINCLSANIADFLLKKFAY